MTSAQSHGSSVHDRIHDLLGDLHLGNLNVLDGGAIAACICCEPGETAENVKDAIRAMAGSSRNNVVMVRVNEESLAQLDQLVEAGIVSSRSEAAAFLIGSGADARKDLFDKIAEKVEEIRKTREELRHLIEADEPETPST